MQKATVIINTVNEVPERLKAAIVSYKDQKGVELQIIVSTIEGDVSVGIAKEYGCDVVISGYKGIYSQLNNALHYIKGDWFCYASGNDLALPNKIFDEIHACLTHQDDKLVCYSAFYSDTFNEKGIATRQLKKFFNYDFERHLDYQHPPNGNFVNDCAIIHKSLIQDYAPFRFQEWNNDSFYDFWLRVYRGSGNVFVYNDNPTWIYQEWNDSKHIVRSKNPSELQQYREIRERMIDSHRRSIEPPKNNVRFDINFDIPKTE